MVILLELIFQGFFEWIYSLILEVWNFFFSSLLDIMTLDFAYIKSHVPIVEDISQIFLAVGWALLLGNLVFQAIRSMVSGLGFEGEDPKLLFARTFVFSFLLLASPQICEIGLNLTSRIMNLLEVPDAINVHLVDSGIFGSLTAAWLLVIIFDIILMFMVLKLLLEVAERYVILAVLTITAPLAFSMGGSKNTTDIFAGWCRMFGSMCLLMVTNLMFFKMLLSVVSTIPSGLDVFPWMVLNISIVKVAKKADEIITRIGLNPAITGDKGKGFGSVLAYTLFRSAASKVMKTVGKTVGAAATGGASATAGGVKAAAGAVGAAGAAGTAERSFRSGGRRGGTQRPGSHQEQQTGGAQQSRTKEPAKDSFGQASQRGGASRKTSVPQGARRGTSNVTGTTESSSTQTGGGFHSGGRFSGSGGRRSGEFNKGGIGRETLQHSGRVGRTGGGSSYRRGVDVYVGDDFDDGYVGTGGKPISTDPSSKNMPAGSGVRSGLPGTARIEPSTDTAVKGGGRRGDGTFRKAPSEQEPQQRRSRPAQPSAPRSTRRNRTPEPSGSGIRRSSFTETGGTASVQTGSRSKRQSSSKSRQEQRTVSSTSENSVIHSGGAGRKIGDASPRSKRRETSPVQQEQRKQAPSAGSQKSSGSLAPPGPAGSGYSSSTERARRFRTRSPSPARRELPGGAIPRGTIPKDGTPRIHPGTAGTTSRSSTERTARSRRRTSTPVQQEAAKAPVSAKTPAKGGPSMTGKSLPVRIDSPPKQRTSSPAKQERGRPPKAAGPPVRGGDPIVRPGKRPAAGPAAPKKQTGPTRTTQTRPGRTNQGGPENGKPK